MHQIEPIGKGEFDIEEEKLVMLIQNGDLSAFDEIFEKFKTKAMRSAYLITGNQSICEDIVQETFIQCYNNIKKLKNPSVFRSWFYKILTRTAWKCKGFA